jgi:signal peptidase I
MNRSEAESTSLACGLAGEIIRTFGEVRLRVFGTSMVPSILPGDLVSVQRADLSEISPGEIVLYSREGRLFVHRAVARSGTHHDPSLITRGDRLSHNDPSVSPSELLGRVTSIQASDGRGHRDVRLPVRMSFWEQWIVRALRISDHTTYLYLRVAGYLPKLFSRRAACRA